MSGTDLARVVPAGELQVAINHAHHQVEASANTMVAKAVECGGLLIEAKDRLPHGSWTGWVEKNFDGSDWTARKYMQLAHAEAGDPGSITGMGSVRTALKSIAAPRQPQLEGPKPDPDSETGRLLAAARTAIRDSDEEEIVDAEVVEHAPSGIEERRWSAALRRSDDLRRAMTEAVSPSLTPAAAAQALTEASVSARRFAVELEQMAEATRRRAA